MFLKSTRLQCSHSMRKSSQSSVDDHQAIFINHCGRCLGLSFDLPCPRKDSRRTEVGASNAGRSQTPVAAARAARPQCWTVVMTMMMIATLGRSAEDTRVPIDALDPSPETPACRSNGNKSRQPAESCHNRKQTARFEQPHWVFFARKGFTSACREPSPPQRAGTHCRLPAHFPGECRRWPAPVECRLGGWKAGVTRAGHPPWAGCHPNGKGSFPGARPTRSKRNLSSSLSPPAIRTVPNAMQAAASSHAAAFAHGTKEKKGI
ncbi:hypothetical protein VTI74DRAFT_6398 [Chaetomium olivicolor]